MDQAGIKREIEELTKRLEQMKSATPAHESSGSHTMEILRLEDELDDKRKALREDRHGE